MGEPAIRKATYEDLYNIPENMTGEIINGELYVTPRPSRRHVLAVSILGARFCHHISWAVVEAQEGGLSLSSRRSDSEITLWFQT